MNTLYRNMIALCLVAGSVLSLSGCGQQTFSVGECVTARLGVFNDRMAKSDCRKTTVQEKLDDKSVYRVSSVIDHGERCPRGTHVTFKHEPHDVTYCLVEY